MNIIVLCGGLSAERDGLMVSTHCLLDGDAEAIRSMAGAVPPEVAREAVDWLGGS